MKPNIAKTLHVIGYDHTLTDDELLVLYPECQEVVEHDSIHDFADIDSDELHILVGTIINRLRGGHHLLLAKTPDERELAALLEVDTRIPSLIHDHAYNELAKQVPTKPVTCIEEFIEAVEKASDDFDQFPKTILREMEDDNDNPFLEFWPTNRASEVHTLRFNEDGIIELDNAIMRRTALVASGYFRTSIIGGKPLDPELLLGFVAIRMALQGPKDLVGYGRVFGPAQEDKTNATLTSYSRTFRAKAIVGVVNVNKDGVSKARPDDVIEVANNLYESDTDKTPIFLHPQGKEIYMGELALKCFRGFYNEADDTVTMGAKSTKHARVDSGAYVLYTADGTGTIELPAIIGMFEEGNDGSVYADKETLAGVVGHLKESVKAVKDFNSMSPELISAYYQCEMLVEEGQRILPGDKVFAVGEATRIWDSKADYGIVRKIVDEATDKLVRIEVHIDAFFEGDIKIRGFGKGLVCPAEAASVQTFDENGLPFKGLLIGAPGIIKDSQAAMENIHSVRIAPATVTSVYCARDFDLAIKKHNPLPDEQDANILVKTYDQATLTFDRLKRTITTHDKEAVHAIVRVGIEASPVGQAVGSTSMTMPQLGYLMSLPTAGLFLSKRLALPFERRVRSLAYCWANATMPYDQVDVA